LIIRPSIEKNENDHHYINLNWEQEKDCNIYVLTKHAYISKQEEQELINRGHILHIPIKKKGGKERRRER
jgi:hypothetical protein